TARPHARCRCQSHRMTRRTSVESPLSHTPVRNKFVPRHRKRCDVRLDGCRVRPGLKKWRLTPVVSPWAATLRRHPRESGEPVSWTPAKAKALDSRFRGNDEVGSSAGMTVGRAGLGSTATGRRLMPARRVAAAKG